jgi:transcriptional regulator with XRE-family HTH domain
MSDPNWWKLKPFVPERLASAREGRGVELAEAEEVSGLPIGAFERGEQVPTRDHIYYFGRAFDFPPAWFTAEMPPTEMGTLHICEHTELCDECFTDNAVAQCDYPTPNGTCDRWLCAAHRNKLVDFEDRDYCGEHMAEAQRPVTKRRSRQKVMS